MHILIVQNVFLKEQAFTKNSLKALLKTIRSKVSQRIIQIKKPIIMKRITIKIILQNIPLTIIPALMLILTVNTIKAQNLTKVQTLDYIFTKSSYRVSIDETGNISIEDKAKFHYSNILLSRQNDTELEFRCKLDKGNCIDSKETGRQVFSYKIKIDKTKLINIYNAFDYLITLLAKERPELTKDPFSPHNYKKNEAKQ